MSSPCIGQENTGKHASFTRLKFAGPRSIVRVNESVTSDTPSKYGPVDAVLISEDRCSDDNRPRTHGHCAESTNLYLSDQGDDDEEFVQCSRACRNIRNEEVEIFRMRTNCKSCSSLSQPYLSIAQSECRDRCNAPLVEGCVFPGSCKSLVCVSGIDSKLPAVVNVSDDTGKGGIIVSVDNARLTASIDPPVFVKYVENMRVPNASIPVTFTGDSHVPLVQNVDISDSENASTNTNNSASSPTESQDEQVSKWLWLGPTIGSLGAIITALAAIVAAYIAQNKEQTPQRYLL
ncbi:hypothetical protein BWQ96_04661 [Gracilariopsis chorda]|uniref:Uncharacterized protein n=1 Tax=Gracilariopsis chorda TaxID=448386 RepID=A0A2V3ITZ2_9FLOR|nr:hypothetical protein BWQ96_04661 [Gracilariopsis chorda]|eukprot:PXF45584.1 hypothetical protein BWQ96_04661 [Gracilariopsis chorda]